ncbi:MAG: hypothetical protein AB7K24_29495 [Gemmataceae bacterium]
MRIVTGILLAAIVISLITVTGSQQYGFLPALVVGVVVGGVMGYLAAFGDFSNQGPAPEVVAALREQLQVDRLEAVSADTLLPVHHLLLIEQGVSGNPQGLAGMNELFPLVYRVSHDGQECLATCYQPPPIHGGGLMQLIHYLSYGKRESRGFLIFPEGLSDWPDFAIESKGNSHADQTGTLLQRFARGHVLRSKGHALDVTRMTDCFLPEPVLTYLIEHPEWELRVLNGSLAVVCPGIDKLDSESMPRLLARGLEIRQLFAQHPRRAANG